MVFRVSVVFSFRGFTVQSLGFRELPCKSGFPKPRVDLQRRTRGESFRIQYVLL